MAAIDIERLARMADDFLKSEYGQHVMGQIKALHTQLHEDAEKADSLELSALKVREARGINTCIGILTNTAKLLDSGFFEHEQEVRNALEDSASTII